MIQAELWRRHVRVAGFLNMLLGGWLAAWPLLPEFPSHDGATQRCFLVIGALLALCGLGRVLAPERFVGLSVANMAFAAWSLLESLDAQGTVY
ncbi:MAG TPA: hypothetical protein VGM84_04810 [Steroidobacteraceae bacterium]|jgi:hypothetical protein